MLLRWPVTMEGPFCTPPNPNKPSHPSKPTPSSVLGHLITLYQMKIITAEELREKVMEYKPNSNQGTSDTKLSSPTKRSADPDSPTCKKKNKNGTSKQTSFLRSIPAQNLQGTHPQTFLQAVYQARKFTVGALRQQGLLCLFLLVFFFFVLFASFFFFF